MLGNTTTAVGAGTGSQFISKISTLGLIYALNLVRIEKISVINVNGQKLFI